MHEDADKGRRDKETTTPSLYIYEYEFIRKSKLRKSRSFGFITSINAAQVFQKFVFQKLIRVPPINKKLKSIR